MNRTAQRIGEIVFQFIYGFVVRKMTKLVARMLKNTFTPFFPISCWLCNVFYLKKYFCEKSVKNTLCKRANDYEQNCIGCSLMLMVENVIEYIVH